MFTNVMHQYFISIAVGTYEYYRSGPIGNGRVIHIKKGDQRNDLFKIQCKKLSLIIQWSRAEEVKLLVRS